jgi:O-antigen biosynthesis protein
MNSTTVPFFFDPPSLSIVIVTWNAAGYLRDCLHSLAADSVLDWAEVIVVDNCSDDGSADMVRAKFPTVRLFVSTKNLGYARGNNYGIERARGKFLLLLNPDTIVYPGTVQKMVAYAEAHPEVGALSPKLYGNDGQIQYDAAVKLPTIWNVFCDFLLLSTLFPASHLFASRKLGYWDHESPREVPAVCGAAMLLRADAVSEVGLLDPCMFYVEDMDLCLRLRDAGYSIFYLGSVAITHHGGGSTPRSAASYARQRQIAFQSFWIYRRKHFGSFSAARLTLAVCLWSLLAITVTLPLRILSVGALPINGHCQLAKSLFVWSVADKMKFSHHLADPPSATLLKRRAAA